MTTQKKIETHDSDAFRELRDHLLGAVDALGNIMDDQINESTKHSNPEMIGQYGRQPGDQNQVEGRIAAQRAVRSALE